MNMNIDIDKLRTFKNSFPVRLKIKEDDDFISVPSMIPFIMFNTEYYRKVLSLSVVYSVPKEVVEAMLAELTGNFTEYPSDDFTELQVERDNDAARNSFTVTGVLDGKYFNIEVDTRLYTNLYTLVQRIKHRFNNNMVYHVYVMSDEGTGEFDHVGRMTVGQIMEIFDNIGWLDRIV